MASDKRDPVGLSVAVAVPQWNETGISPYLEYRCEKGATGERQRCQVGSISSRGFALRMLPLKPSLTQVVGESRPHNRHARENHAFAPRFYPGTLECRRCSEDPRPVSLAFCTQIPLPAQIVHSRPKSLIHVGFQPSSIEKW